MIEYDYDYDYGYDYKLVTKYRQHTDNDPGGYNTRH